MPRMTAAMAAVRVMEKEGAAQAASIPTPCITGQAPRVRLHKEDFQAVGIESTARPVTGCAVTVPALPCADGRD